MMRSVVMAVLADYMNSLHKEILVTAAVGLMANEAIFFSRGMYPDKRSAFIDMTGKAEQIWRFRLDHSPGQGTVYAVTIAAFYLSLQDGMTGLLAHLCLCLPVAFKTDRQLIRYGISRMHAMAGGTGNVISLMLANIPVNHIFLLGVALKTYGAQLIGTVSGLLAEGENVDTATTTLLDMHRSRTVAGFAGILGLWSLDIFLKMDRF